MLFLFLPSFFLILFLHSTSCFFLYSLIFCNFSFIFLFLYSYFISFQFHVFFLHSIFLYSLLFFLIFSLLCRASEMNFAKLLLLLSPLGKKLILSVAWWYRRNVPLTWEKMERHDFAAKRLIFWHITLVFRIELLTEFEDSFNLLKFHAYRSSENWANWWKVQTRGIKLFLTYRQTF
jgi:hypothetical protein